MKGPEKLTMRPYARLLTMLGEQLIKNGRIALIELIKNSYDADSPWVKVTFKGFDDDYGILPSSKIIIEDAGHGMDTRILREHWLNPATPEKKNRKGKKSTTRLGRVIQGEKGIGRFAVLKLGRKIRITTRTRKDDTEHVLDYDFSVYDDEFLSENGVPKDLFLDELAVTYRNRPPRTFEKRQISLGATKVAKPAHGTRIEIADLKGAWTPKRVEDVHRDVTRFQSIFTRLERQGRSQTKIGIGDVSKRKKRDPEAFDVWIYKDMQLQRHDERYLEQLEFLLNERAVFRIEDGRFDANKEEFRFSLNGESQVLDLRDPRVTGLEVFRQRFERDGVVLDKRDVECGAFGFAFYIFDFSSDAKAKHLLDAPEKKALREHRIYLYRDGIRVYPYGEPDDDWLRIDAYRGTKSAGHFLSNDQVVGYISITQEENPKLQDKTNREGLIDEGEATEDFISLIQILLRYFRHGPYARYREDLKGKKAHDVFRKELVKRMLDEVREAIEGKSESRSLSALKEASRAYQAERAYLVGRAEATEELAGIGLSVETTSHDIMAIMDKAMIGIDGLIKDSLHGDVDSGELSKELQSLRGMLSFIEAQLKDIQLLFRSSKQRRRNIRVHEVVDKVQRIYRRILKDKKVELSVVKVAPPLIAKTTDAVLLQLLLNLFDNSLYWLGETGKHRKKVQVLLDGPSGKMVFSDNGPGVHKDDAPYIFEPFYSGKGEDGRGLGLYIAKQLLERHDFGIELADRQKDKLLPGANFVVSFVAVED